MGRFILFTILLLVAGGLILHYGVNIPYISNFLGNLPGDLLLRKGNVTVFFPLTSAAIVSFIITMISYGLFRS